MRSANTSREPGAVLAEQPRYPDDSLWKAAQQAARDYAKRIREREQLLARYSPELIDETATAIGCAWAQLVDDCLSHRELTREFAIAALQVFDHRRKEAQQNADETPLDSPSPSLEQRDGGTGIGAVSPSDTEGGER